MSGLTVISLCVALWAGATAAAEGCPIYETRAWHAWKDRAGENGGNRLIVFGQVDLRSPGFVVDWKASPTDRMDPPTLRVLLKVTHPNKLVVQVITPTDLTLILPTDISRFRSVIVLCEGRSLVELGYVNLTD